jgi:hypothetical protein
MRAIRPPDLAFNETVASKFFKKSHVYRHIARKGQQDTQTIDPHRLLRDRGDRACKTGQEGK